MSRPRASTGGRFLWGALVLLLGASGCSSCLKRQPRDSVAVLPYPRCPGGADAGEGRTVVEQALHAAGSHPTPELFERYTLTERGCHRVLTLHQEWSRQIDDVEVVYDEHYRPLRAWKRMAVPAPGGRSPLVDTRRYELRQLPVSMSLRSGRDLRHYVFKRRETPIAVVGPGRGLLVPWLRRQALEPERSVRGPVLDIRELTERLEDVTLRRERDADYAGLGRVQIYTVYGRESVFVRDGRVVGDLLGLRPADPTFAPPSTVQIDPPDPVGTP